MMVEYKRLVMAGPMRWVVLSQGEDVTTFTFLVKVHYTAQGQGSVLFVRSDLSGHGTDDIFGVFSDNPTLARYLRDEIFSYTVFAGGPNQSPPAPIVEAAFESVGRVPLDTVESMRAADGTTVTLALQEFGLPVAYIRRVRENLMEVGALARPSRFTLEINGMTPVGEPGVGPLAEAPPIGGDLQNVWYLTEGEEIETAS